MTKQSSFALDISKAIEGITEDLEEIQRGTFHGLFSAVVIGTPVGDPTRWKTKYKPKGYIGGTLRGAWNASTGAMDETITKRIDKTGAATINDMAEVVLNADLGQTLYFTNPQPHAIPVEYGHSSQRPAGMVRVAVAETQRILDEEVAKR